MDIADHFGLGERIEVTIVLEVFLGVFETFAANIGFTKAVGANGGAHGAVDDDDAVAQGTAKEFGVGRHGEQPIRETAKSKFKINASRCDDLIFFRRFHWADQCEFAWLPGSIAIDWVDTPGKARYNHRPHE